MPEPGFDEVVSLYCDRPLSFATRVSLDEALTDEVIEDINNALDSLKESDRMSLNDFEKEIGY